MRFRIERSFSKMGYNIWLLDYKNNQGFIAKPINLEFEQIDDGAILPEPTLFIDEFLARDLIPEVQKGLAGLNYLKKEDYDINCRVEKQMQSHIDSLKIVLDRVLK